MPLVRLRDVSRVFTNGVQALGGASLDIEAGEFLSVLGPSGCGKSTLLRLIAGLAEPTAGTIDWPQGKPDLGFVFQEPTLMPWTTALAHVALPLKLRGLARSERDARAAEALAGVINKVILMTADFVSRADVIASGAVGLLEKPFPLSALRAAVANV